MTTLRLVSEVSAANPNLHDLYVDDSGQLEIIGETIDNLDSYTLAVAQSIKTRLLFVRGEWYQDQRLGTPWRERVWKKGVTEAEIRRMLTDVVLDTPGVKAVASVDIDLDNTTRTATITNLQITTETNLEITISDIDRPMVFDAPQEAL